MGNYLYGFDLGMECTGVTIFNLDNLEPVHITSIKTKEKETHGKRLKHIEDEVIKLTVQYPPKVIAIERGFSRFNTSTQVIYRVHGVINKFFHDVKQHYYPPKTVKESILNGNATKKQVMATIQEKYPDTEFANEDESDSFAVAICYLIKSGLIKWDKPEKKTNRKKKVKGDKE